MFTKLIILANLLLSSSTVHKLAKSHSRLPLLVVFFFFPVLTLRMIPASGGKVRLTE
jgi:hypothetical protein